MLTAGTRAGIHFDWLIWAETRNRTTGAIEAGGIWTGGLDQTFNVPGTPGTRIYRGAGLVASLDPINYTAGVDNIQSQSITLNGVSGAVRDMILYYDAKQAVVELHRLHRPPATHLLGSATFIELAFAGNIDEVEFSRDASDLRVGGSRWTCNIRLMSASRMGTRTLQLKKSDASHKLAFPTDAGRKYSSSKAKVVWMGEVENPHKRSIKWRSGGRPAGGGTGGGWFS